MVGTGPSTEFTNGLTVKTDSLPTKRVELLISQHNLGPVHGNAEYAKLSFFATHHGNGILGGSVVTVGVHCNMTL